MRNALPMIWFVLAGLALLAPLAGALSVRPDPAALAMSGSQAVFGMLHMVAVALTYLILVRVRPSTPLNLLGAVHAAFAALGIAASSLFARAQAQMTFQTDASISHNQLGLIGAASGAANLIAAALFVLVLIIALNTQPATERDVQLTRSNTAARP